jgi:hypothetical protein
LRGWGGAGMLAGIDPNAFFRTPAMRLLLTTAFALLALPVLAQTPSLSPLPQQQQQPGAFLPGAVPRLGLDAPQVQILEPSRQQDLLDDAWTGYLQIDSIPFPTTGPVLTLQDLEAGTMLPPDALRQTPLDPAQVQALQWGGDTTLDLQSLGLATAPQVPVNLFALYDAAGTFKGLATPPPGVSSEAFLLSSARRGDRAKPVQAKQQGKDVSSLSHKILSVLSEICAVSIRPRELTVTLGGGWSLGVEATAEISALIDVEQSCARLGTELQEARSAAPAPE